MLLLEYAPIASISGIAWNPSHSASGYSVTFGSDKAGVSQLMRTLKSSKKFSVWVCSLLEYALVASILCNFQNPFHSASGYPVSSNGDELGAWRLISGPKFQKKGKNTWTTHEAIARWAQRGTRTRSLEIRSLARYHCASRARIVVAAMIIERQNKTYCLGLGLSFTFSRMQRDDDMQVKSPIAHSKDKLLTHLLRWFWWLLVWYWQRHPGWKDVIEIRVCCFLHGS